jgi:hypothetical protein
VGTGGCVFDGWDLGTMGGSLHRLSVGGLHLGTVSMGFYYYRGCYSEVSMYVLLCFLIISYFSYLSVATGRSQRTIVLPASCGSCVCCSL